MIVILQRGTTEAQTQACLDELEQLGLRGQRLDILEKPVIHVVEGPGRLAGRLRMDRVEALVPTSGPRIRGRGRHFYPYHFINWLTAALLLLGLLVLLSGMFPPEVGSDVDPTDPPPGITPPWYLGGPQALLALLPARLGWMTVLALSAIVLFVPWLDRSRKRGAAFLLVALAVAAWFVLMVWGAF